MPKKLHKAAMDLVREMDEIQRRGFGLMNSLCEGSDTSVGQAGDFLGAAGSQFMFSWSLGVSIDKFFNQLAIDKEKRHEHPLNYVYFDHVTAPNISITSHNEQIKELSEDELQKPLLELMSSCKKAIELYEENAAHFSILTKLAVCFVAGLKDCINSLAEVMNLKAPFKLITRIDAAQTMREELEKIKSAQESGGPNKDDGLMSTRSS